MLNLMAFGALAVAIAYELTSSREERSIPLLISLIVLAVVNLLFAIF